MVAALSIEGTRPRVIGGQIHPSVFDEVRARRAIAKPADVGEDRRAATLAVAPCVIVLLALGCRMGELKERTGLSDKLVALLWRRAR